MESPLHFFRAVRAEAKKVSWPSRKETLNLTAIVIVMMLIVALFFLGVDQLFAWIVQQLLGVGR